MRDRGSPHGEGRAWRGHISATQMPHKYLSPPHIFSQISTPESKRKGGICLENVSSCFDPSLHYLCSKFEEQLS